MALVCSSSAPFFLAAWSLRVTTSLSLRRGSWRGMEGEESLEWLVGGQCCFDGWPQPPPSPPSFLCLCHTQSPPQHALLLNKRSPSYTHTHTHTQFCHTHLHRFRPPHVVTMVSPLSFLPLTTSSSSSSTALLTHPLPPPSLPPSPHSLSSRSSRTSSTLSGTRPSSVVAVVRGEGMEWNGMEEQQRKRRRMRKGGRDRGWGGRLRGERRIHQNMCCTAGK